MTQRYYNERIKKTLKFIVPEGKKVLFFGCLDGDILRALKPSLGVGVETEENYLQKAYRKNTKNLSFFSSDYEKFKSKTKFDYIVLNGVLGKSSDIMLLLDNLSKVCHSRTRVIIYQHNFLWQGLLSFLEKIDVKRREGIQNWLSIADLKSYLDAADLEVTRVFRRTLAPAYLAGIGSIVNFVAQLVPLFDFLKLDQFVIARPRSFLFPIEKQKSLTICLTVRNEKGNIEKIIKSIPRICKKQEILFVEGHSTDGTGAEIKRLAQLYPNKNIKVINQPGKGQGDAIKIGFREAKGDIVILYEGDGTSDPRDIKYFYDALKKGTFEFIEGSRFVYPLERKSMPLFNQIGNALFAKWFSFFLGQHTTDVLSGIKAMNKKDYMNLYERWGFLGLQDPFGDFELLYGAARMGLKFGEIPMHYYPRTYGKSKTKIFTHGPFLIKMAAKGYWIFRRV